MRRYHHGHSLGAGVVIGLMVTQRPLLVFAVGVLSGAALVLASGALRRFGRLLGQRLHRHDHASAESRASEAAAVLLAAELSDEELESERERRIGLRQGKAAGVRAAARVEAREQAKRDAMLESEDRFGRKLVRQAIGRALSSDAQ